MSANLIAYLPDALQPVSEFKQLTGAENPEFDLAGDAVQTLETATFPEVADEGAIARWEQMLGIVPESERTLDERRYTVAAKLAEDRPYTEAAVRRVLTKMAGGAENYALTIDGQALSVTVKIALTSKYNRADIMSYLKRVLPANMLLDVDLKYNKHKLFEKYTYAQLTAYTHKTLREEVMA